MFLIQDYPEPDFSRSPLEFEGLENDAIKQFENWLREAYRDSYPMPNAMSLATASSAGNPTARTVLLKSYDQKGFVFYTNYGSRKARQIAENAEASLLFPWVQLGRQVIIMGGVEKISRDESLEYFNSRPRGSQLGAWASEQSTIISSREELEATFSALKLRFSKGPIPLPDFWGGYRIIPSSIEFWQNRTDRMHDRFMYNRQESGRWAIDRLTP
mgnify:CR=1 FL=1